MKKTLRVIVCSILLMSFTHVHADLVRVTDEGKRSAILSKIPVSGPEGDLLQRLMKLGFSVESLVLEKVGKEDAEPPIYLAGDQIIHLKLSEPNLIVRRACDFKMNPEFIKRGSRYIPQNLAANWLVNGRCVAP